MQWTEAAPAGPDRTPGTHEAEARLTVRLEGIVYRALRADEVEEWQGHTRLRGGKLEPKKRVGSRMTARDAVRMGTTVHDSPYIHVTQDAVVAAWMAVTGGESSGFVAPIRVQAIPPGSVINLCSAAGRARADIGEDSCRRARLSAVHLLVSRNVDAPRGAARENMMLP